MSLDRTRTGGEVFLVGAGQIYRAKFRRSGLVMSGLYRFVRHPQYIALTLFGVGIVLTWGRAITFAAFSVMMFLCYYLAKSEERSCLRLFGAAYERYCARITAARQSSATPTAPDLCLIQRCPLACAPMRW